MGFGAPTPCAVENLDARDPGLIPGSGRSPGEGNGNLLQYAYLGNPVDRGAWRATVHGAAQSRTRGGMEHGQPSASALTAGESVGCRVCGTAAQ